MCLKCGWKELLSGAVAIVLLIIAICLTLLLEDGYFPTTLLPFDLKDRTIDYPVLKPTVDDVVLIVVFTVLVILMIVLWLLFYREKFQSNIALFCFAIYLVLLGEVLVILLTNVIKVYRGGLRPHFIKACLPNQTIVEELDREGTSWVNLTVTIMICTAEGKPDYRWSFPSGHASVAFYSAILSIFILQKFPMNLKCHTLWSNIRVLLQFVIITFSLWVALSRLVDYYHHWWDVLFGGLMGTVFALMLFYRYLCPVMQRIKGED